MQQSNLVPLWSLLDAGNHHRHDEHFDRLLDKEVPEEVDHHGGQPLVGSSVPETDSIESHKTHPTCRRSSFVIFVSSGLVILPPTGNAEKGEEPSNEETVSRPTFWSIVWIRSPLERLLRKVNQTLFRSLLDNLQSNRNHLVFYSSLRTLSKRLFFFPLGIDLQRR